MVKFQKRIITRGQTLGDKLKNARLEQGIKIEEASRITKIQSKYLSALEAADYQALPGEVYGKIWLKIYADFLGLDARQLVGDYKIEHTVSDRIQKSEHTVNNRPFSRDSLLLRPRSIKLGIIGLVILTILGYFIWELTNIVRSPDITISTPANNISTTATSLTIDGQTEPEAELRINQELVILDEGGHFSQTINLVVGLNKLEISAKKKHSRTRKVELNILRELIN